MMIKSMLLNLGLFVLRTTEDGGAGGGIDTSWLKNGDSGAVQPFIDLVHNLTYAAWQLILTIGISAAVISLAFVIISIIIPGKNKDEHKVNLVTIIFGVIALVSVVGIITALVNMGLKASESLEKEASQNRIEGSVLVDKQEIDVLAYADRLCGGGLLG